jgi:hypothetical protein
MEGENEKLLIKLLFLKIFCSVKVEQTFRAFSSIIHVDITFKLGTVGEGWEE